MFRKILKFKKIVLVLISILIMILTYPLSESVLFSISEELMPWKYDASMSFKEIIVSDFENGTKLKNDMIRVANKNNINLFFKDYEIDNLNYNLVYYHISDQKYLDKLPFTEEISIKKFNNSNVYFTNNDKEKSLDLISSKKYITSISSFKNYKSKRFLGQLLVFGSDEDLGTFENELNKITGNNLEILDFDPNKFTYDFSNLQIIVFMAQEFLKNYQFQVFIIMLLLLIVIDIDSQKRKIGIYKLNGYSNFNIFAKFLEEYIVIFLASSILAIPPNIFLNQKVFNTNSFKFLPYYFFIALIIVVLIFLVIFILSFLISKISIIDTVYRRRENHRLNIGFFILKLSTICILGLSLTNFFQVKKDYDLYKNARLSYEDIHNDYYILSSSNFAANRQVYEAKDTATREIINKDGVLYFEIDYDARPNIVSANMNYINSLKLSTVDNKKIEIDENIKDKTYIVTKKSYKKLKDNIKNSKMLYQSLGLNTDDPNILVIDSINMYPQINEYIHGSKPTDEFVIIVEDSGFLNPANILYKSKNVKMLEREFFPIFDKYISSNLLKFEKEEDFYGKFEKDARVKYIESLKKLILIVLIYILINIYIFNISLSNISKKLGVSMLLGNPIVEPSINILLDNIFYSLMSCSAVSYFSKFDLTIYFKILLGLILIDLVVYGMNLLKYKNNLISILKSSMEE